MDYRKIGFRLTLAFAFAAGGATGFYGRGLYDGQNTPRKLAIGDRFNASVASVYDADTMTVQAGGQSYKIRVWGIDAPERSQKCLQNSKTVACGITARDHMRILVSGKTIACEVKGMDGNRDRPVALCKAGNTDPAAELVQNGWAFSDTKYSDNPYATEQNQARSQRKGLWDMKYITPARWRACGSLGRGGDGDGAIPVDCQKPLGPLVPR